VEYFCCADWTGQITLKQLQKIARARIDPIALLRGIDGRAHRCGAGFAFHAGTPHVAYRSGVGIMTEISRR